jgi:hypothetical protein
MSSKNQLGLTVNIPINDVITFSETPMSGDGNGTNYINVPLNTPPPQSQLQNYDPLDPNSFKLEGLQLQPQQQQPQQPPQQQTTTTMFSQISISADESGASHTKGNSQLSPLGSSPNSFRLDQVKEENGGEHLTREISNGFGMTADQFEINSTENSPKHANRRESFKKQACQMLCLLTPTALEVKKQKFNALYAMFNSEQDISKPDFNHLVEQLNEIRTSDSNFLLCACHVKEEFNVCSAPKSNKKTKNNVKKSCKKPNDSRVIETSTVLVPNGESTFKVQVIIPDAIIDFCKKDACKCHYQALSKFIRYMQIACGCAYNSEGSSKKRASSSSSSSSSSSKAKAPFDGKDFTRIKKTLVLLGKKSDFYIQWMCKKKANTKTKFFDGLGVEKIKNSIKIFFQPNLNSIVTKMIHACYNGTKGFQTTDSLESLVHDNNDEIYKESIVGPTTFHEAVTSMPRSRSSSCSSSSSRNSRSRSRSSSMLTFELVHQVIESYINTWEATDRGKDHPIDKKWMTRHVMLHVNDLNEEEEEEKEVLLEGGEKHITRESIQIWCRMLHLQSLTSNSNIDTYECRIICNEILEYTMQERSLYEESGTGLSPRRKKSKKNRSWNGSNSDN